MPSIDEEFLAKRFMLVLESVRAEWGSNAIAYMEIPDDITDNNGEGNRIETRDRDLLVASLS